MFVVLRDGHVYTPEDVGTQDVLCAAGRVVKVAPHIAIPREWEDVDEVDARGKVVVPGFVDPHIHIAGGGGEAGPSTRNFDIQLTQITRFGVTTVVGPLGVDGTSKQVATLLAKAAGLEEEGITAYVYSGGYTIPSATLTGSVTNDIAFVEKVVGVKIAISDHRCSQPSVEDLYRLAARARMGGLVGNKAGLLHLHVGPGKEGLQPVFAAVERSEVPITQFLPTHMNRSPLHMEQSIAFGKAGGRVDFTAGVSPRRGFDGATRPSDAVRRMLDAGVPPARITMSSDANGNAIMRDAEGKVVDVVVQSVGDLLDEFQDVVQGKRVPVPTALAVFTSSPAGILRLRGKGSLAPGSDGDLLVLSGDLAVDRVYARGRLMVKEGEPMVKGLFEK